MPVNAQIGNVSYVLCTIVGGALAIAGNFGGVTLGTLASFLSLNKSFNMPINQVSMQLNAIVMALAGADRIFKLLDEEPEVDDGYVTRGRSRRGAQRITNFHHVTSRLGPPPHPKLKPS